MHLFFDGTGHYELVDDPWLKDNWDMQGLVVRKSRVFNQRLTRRRSLAALQDIAQGG